MRTAYIANVGTRDIQLDGKPLAANEIRTQSQHILDNYNEHRARLTAPILRHGIQEILDKLGKDGCIDRVLLFVTDQSSDVSQSKSDTLYLGGILELFLPDVFGAKIGKVECCSIPHDPANYDRMRVFFGDALKSRIKPNDFTSIWVAPVGGIPACNTGMLLNAVRLYRRHCQLMFVYENAAVQTLDLHRDKVRDAEAELFGSTGTGQAKVLLSIRELDAPKSMPVDKEVSLGFGYLAGQGLAKYDSQSRTTRAQRPALPASLRFEVNCIFRSLSPKHVDDLLRGARAPGWSGITYTPRNGLLDAGEYCLQRGRYTSRIVAGASKH